MATISTQETEGADETRLLRPIAIIEHLAGAGQPVTLSQLSARLGIPKATLLRLMKSLEKERFVVHAPDERGYMPGPALAHLALTVLGNNSFTRACRVVLRSLVASTGESCNITALDGDRVLYIERVETAEPLRQHLEPGAHVPLHCTASGKLFLSQMPPLVRRQLLAHLPLPRMTSHTFTDAGLLAAELDRLSVRRIGVDNEEFVLGMVAVAVPVRAADGRTIAALACHAPSARQSLNDLVRMVPRIEEAAGSLGPLLQHAAR
jgi:DNA-binding IclR family transcriptional regulator